MLEVCLLPLGCWLEPPRVKVTAFFCCSPAPFASASAFFFCSLFLACLFFLLRRLLFFSRSAFSFAFSFAFLASSELAGGADLPVSIPCSCRALAMRLSCWLTGSKLLAIRVLTVWAVSPLLASASPSRCFFCWAFRTWGLPSSRRSPSLYLWNYFVWRSHSALTGPSGPSAR